MSYNNLMVNVAAARVAAGEARFLFGVGCHVCTGTGYDTIPNGRGFSGGCIFSFS